MSFNFHSSTIFVPFSNLVFLVLVCSFCVCCFAFAMDTLSSSAPSKRHSPPKAYFIDELQEVKTISAQQDEELRQMEARLQILEVKHMEKRLAKLELKHERSSHSIHGRIILLDIVPKVLPMLTTMEKNIGEGGITIILMERAITVTKDITKKQSLNFLL